MAREFIEKIAPENLYWVLGANYLSDNTWLWRTFSGVSRRSDAEAWLRAAFSRSAEVWFCLGDVIAPLSSAPADKDISGMSLIAAHADALDGFIRGPERLPHIAYFSQAGNVMAIWRLTKPISASAARWQAGVFAASCCTRRFSALPVNLCVPVPTDLYPIGFHDGCIGRCLFHAPAYDPEPLAAPALPSPTGGRGLTVVKEDAENAERAKQLVEEIAKFGVGGRIDEWRVGPVVTTFLFVPDAGVKARKLSLIGDDVAREMEEDSIRIVRIRKSRALGIEIPNDERKTIPLAPFLNDPRFLNAAGKLRLIIGVDTYGDLVVKALEDMPHLMAAGATKSGKSVWVNATIVSLISRLPPSECKILLIDPKRTEFAIYRGIPHLLTPVVTTQAGAAKALKWLYAETMRRYEMFEGVTGAVNLEEYNQRVPPEKRLAPIVAFVDEVADLMIGVGDKDSPEVKNAAIISAMLQKLAQIARAAGVYLVLAMQRPSTDVIKGAIKANFLCRMAFQVQGRVDSEVIIGVGDAKNCLGKGDALFQSADGRIERVHGALFSTKELEELVNELCASGSPEYVDLDAVGDRDEQDLGESDNQDSVLDEALRRALADGGKSRKDLFAVAVAAGFKSEGSLSEALSRIGARKEEAGTFPRTVIWTI